MYLLWIDRVPNSGGSCQRGGAFGFVGCAARINPKALVRTHATWRWKSIAPLAGIDTFMVLDYLLKRR
jgi:hypothetical protein